MNLAGNLRASLQEILIYAASKAPAMNVVLPEPPACPGQGAAAAGACKLIFRESLAFNPVRGTIEPPWERVRREFQYSNPAVG